MVNGNLFVNWKRIFQRIFLFALNCKKISYFLDPLVTCGPLNMNIWTATGNRCPYWFTCNCLTCSESGTLRRFTYTAFQLHVVLHWKCHIWCSICYFKPTWYTHTLVGIEIQYLTLKNLHRNAVNTVLDLNTKLHFKYNI